MYDTVRCLDCNWMGEYHDLIAGTKFMHENFVYCPNCGSDNIEDCDEVFGPVPIYDPVDDEWLDPLDWELLQFEQLYSEQFLDELEKAWFEDTDC